MTDINKAYMEFMAKLDQCEKESVEEVSKMSRIEQDLLHFLENETCDAVTMVLIAKELQRNRRIRRYHKVCLEQVQSIRSNGTQKTKNLNKFEEKGYTYKSDIMSHIEHKPKRILRCKAKEGGN
jgi:hypothetical protein